MGLNCNIPDIKSMQNRNKMLEMEDEQQYNQNNTTIIPNDTRITPERAL
jgi:hypothetical protein